MRALEFSPQGWGDLAWLISRNPRLAKRATKLIDALVSQPFDGIGKPEPLKGDKAGLWSRRIDSEHRLVYRVTESAVIIVRARGHYD